MRERIRLAIGPLYLFLCLVLGGSAQGVWGNMVLRLLAVLLICWAIMHRREEPLPGAIRQLLAIAALGLLLGLIQLVPLPVAAWTALPGREIVTEGLRLLGSEPGAMPLSLAPYDGIAAMLGLLPPLGMIAAMAGLRAYRNDWLAAALIAGTAAGVLLGTLQISSPDPQHSPWYLYRRSNFGVATGFFANSNHMASLLVVTIPFIAALAGWAREESKDRRVKSAAVAMGAGGLLVIVTGIGMNGSLAGYSLAVPVLLASLLLLAQPPRALVRAGLAGIALAGLVAVVLLWSNPNATGNVGTGASISSRQEIIAHSLALTDRFGWAGSGLGSFEQVYRLTEDPATVGRFFVNHAHNDYVELAVETGLAGIALILLFLLWWGVTAWRTIRSPAASQFALAGVIASAALLIHSVVDYPLRTAAMSSVFAMALVLMICARRTAAAPGDLWPARHLTIG